MSASLLQSTPLKRVFKLGALEVECNSPNATFEESIKAIRKNYPFFRFGKIYEDDGLVDGAQTHKISKYSLRVTSGRWHVGWMGNRTIGVIIQSL